jgi:hypothetical protein
VSHRGATYFTAPNNSAAPDFFPIDGLGQVGGDTGDILFKAVASNQIQYTQPVDDPLYSAHKELRYWDGSIMDYKSSYTADYPLGGVACTQHVRHSYTMPSLRSTAC